MISREIRPLRILRVTPCDSFTVRRPIVYRNPGLGRPRSLQVSVESEVHPFVLTKRFRKMSDMRFLTVHGYQGNKSGAVPNNSGRQK